MKQNRKGTLPKGFDPNPAKEICSIVGLIPHGVELQDVSDVFERLLTTPEGTGLESLAGTKSHLDMAFRGIVDPIEQPDYHELLLLIRSAAALFALGECFKGLPEELLQQFDFQPLADERVHQLLFENARFQISYDDFVAHGNSFPNWLSIARKYAEILDSCSRYMQVRSWLERLDSIAYIGGSPFKNNSALIELFFKKVSQFGAGILTIRDGLVAIESDKFAEAFVGAPIERIRRCKACKRIYWAERIDMKGCSTPCSKIIRMRNWRSKPENRLKEQYRDLKRYEKKVKEKK